MEKKIRNLGDKLPDEERIGGTLDGEINDAGDSLQDSRVSESVASAERVESDSVSRRKRPLESENSGTVHRRERDKDGDRRREHRRTERNSHFLAGGMTENKLKGKREDRGGFWLWRFTSFALLLCIGERQERGKKLSERH